VSLLRALAPFLAYLYLLFVGWTSRVRREGFEHEEALLAAGRPFIYAFWHQRQVFFVYTHRNRGLKVLVSRSRDGEIISRLLELCGFSTVRGSSSRGGSESVRELLDFLCSGGRVSMTPDGPRGPARKAKDGVLFLAQKAGCPILAASNELSRRWEFSKAWDRFHFPLPFSRAFLCIAPPLHVAPGDDLQAKAEELSKILDAMTARAEQGIAEWDRA
jgi:hypothetical protein